MLIEIRCDQFISNGEVREPIRFHEGLNAVVGDDNRSNSIGKSTLLMIIDFVFGGKDYVTKCLDVQEHVGNHTINFTFKFGDEYFYFSRNNIEWKNIWICDSDYNKLPDQEPLSVDDYCLFLAEKYGITTEGLKWRGAVARFIRVFKRDTMDGERPLLSAKNEKAEDAIKKYMQLFGRYAAVEAQIKQAALAEDEKETFRKSQAYEYIRIAKNDTEYKDNEKRIAVLEQREKELADSSGQGLLDLDTMKAHQISELNDQLINYRRQKARVQNQLNAIRKEMTEGKKSFKKTYSDLERFFPGIDFKEIGQIEQFHQSLAKVLADEFKESEKDLVTAYAMLNNEIIRIKEQISAIESIPNVTQAVLKEYAQITTELNTIRDANKNFNELKRLKENASDYAEARDKMIAEQLQEIEDLVNQKVREINARIVQNEIQQPSRLRLEKLTKYSFTHKDDGGSGAQWRGVIAFDLANMQVAPIPFIVHDSDISDPIEKPALTQIIKEYVRQSESGKQVFASFRSLEFYEKEAQEIIIDKRVIQLSAGGNELFGRAWNKEKHDESDGNE